jgi:hypothetical protein
MPGSSSAQKGRLLLLCGLVGAWFAIALILLRGGLGLARRGGLGGFIRALLLITHSISFQENLKNIFQVLSVRTHNSSYYNDNIRYIYLETVFLP